MRKSYLFISIVIILAFILTGCNSYNSNHDSKEKKVIVTSFYPLYFFTKNLTVNIDQIEVRNLTAANVGCLHDYQMKPSDLISLESADLFVTNGAGMENFLGNVSEAYPNLHIVEASEGIELIYKNGIGNPHVWVSVTNAELEVKNISKAMQIKFPEYSLKIIENEKNYIKKMEIIKKEIKSLKPLFSGKNIITFHEAFPYFAKDFGLNIIAVIEREPGSEPTPKELNNLIDLVKRLKIKALFAEPQYSKNAADTIARNSGSIVYILDPFVTGDINAGLDSYEKTMEMNIKTLKKALID